MGKNDNHISLHVEKNDRYEKNTLVHHNPVYVFFGFSGGSVFSND